MRGNYLFDEVSGTDNGIPYLKFCQGENTIVKIILHHDSYDFHFELNEKEYEEFCSIPGDSTIIVQKICTDEANPKCTGTVTVHVCNVDSFQDVKKLCTLRKSLIVNHYLKRMQYTENVETDVIYVFIMIKSVKNLGTSWFHI